MVMFSDDISFLKSYLYSAREQPENVVADCLVRVFEGAGGEYVCSNASSWSTASAEVSTVRHYQSLLR
jgi:hypothetical protein